MKFEPERLKVSKGTVIQWIFQNPSSLDIKHVIGFDDESLEIESNPLKKDGDTFKCQFNETGTFSYRCHIHSTRLKGVIEVGSSTDVKSNRFISGGNSKNINKLFGKTAKDQGESSI
jgi:plastocyanin